MSIFKNILAKIFPPQHSANSAAPSATAPASGAAGSAPSPTSATSGATPAASPAAATGTSQTQMSQPVDVEAVLSEMQSKHSEKLNWKTSIVDLLKLLGLDSSLTARKELAAELHYNGDTNDSAAMNIWLHKEVMRKFAENGGKVPADLRS